MLSALLVTGRLSGGRGVTSFVRRGFRGLGWGWFLFSLLSPLLFLVPAASYLRGLGQVNFFPYLGLLAWGLWLATSGLGEKIGWRGFALPRFQQRSSMVRSALVLGILWAVWHVRLEGR